MTRRMVLRGYNYRQRERVQQSAEEERVRQPDRNLLSYRVRQWNNGEGWTDHSDIVTAPVNAIAGKMTERQKWIESDHWGGSPLRVIDLDAIT